jgi:SAM-dependent methyltransferase
MLAPAWLDLVAVLGGVRPPARTDGFAWCDLGCGQGVTAAILAATHPEGAFHGIDAMAVHTDHAAGLAQEAGAANVHFHTADFAAALARDLPLFDYIVAHGVYSWVDGEIRACLRQFIDRRLKPGGLVYVSYNALPGWTGDLPFQHLVSALAANAPGDSAVRFAAAARLIQRLADSGAAAFASSYIVRELRQRPDDYRPGYLVHEFLHAGWRPLYVIELRHDMAEIGLAPVGSAILLENFDRWVLSRRERAIVAEIADPDLRELVRDFCIDQRFRCDVFARDAAKLDEAEQRRLLFAAGLALARPPSAIQYRAATPAGRLDYANPAAQAVVGGLAAGARNLGEIPPAAAAPQDLLANALALCAAGDVRPVETGRVPVAALNRALRRRLASSEEIPLIALPCGTALELDHQLLGLLSGEMNPAWRDFLASHGV